MQDDLSNSIDIYVGAKVRERRKALGISQEVLAKQLAISSQQLQKYEKGVNRIGASRLYELAEAMQVTVLYFFEGLGEILGKDREKSPEVDQLNDQVYKLTKTLKNFQDIEQRQKLISVVIQLLEIFLDKNKTTEEIFSILEKGGDNG